ncbi:MAG: hypothetical protein ACRELX_00470 [Longimicrobiales bacterium]
MRTKCIALAATLVIGACGGAASAPETPAPTGAPAFAYALPESEPLLYELADSGGFTMQIEGAGEVDVDVVGHATTQLDFEPQGDGFSVTVTVSDLSGTFTNSMGPTVTVGNEHRPPPAVLTVGHDGEVTMVDQPQFAAPLSQIFTPEGLYKGLFIRLPERAVEQGLAWTDTIRTEGTNEGMTVSTTSIVTSVWSRDTTVSGRKLAVIESRLQNTIEVSGTTQGMEIRQNLEGSGTATSLWDPAARVLVERIEIGQASGTTDLPTMGMTGMPVTAHSHQALRLQR